MRVGLYRFIVAAGGGTFKLTQAARSWLYSLFLGASEILDLQSIAPSLGLVL
jgi:hypothetical protein